MDRTNRDRAGTVSDHVATEVRAYLGRRRISARQAAFKLGWSQTYISHRLNGRRPFDLDDLELLADLLDVQVVDFFAGPVLSSASSKIPEVGITNVDKCTPVTLTASLTSRCVTRGIDAPLELAA